LPPVRRTFNEEQIAAIASGFVNNTTLRDLEFQVAEEATWNGVDSLAMSSDAKKMSAQSLDFLQSPSDSKSCCEVEVEGGIGS
jgi:hypothetical protein